MKWEDSLEASAPLYKGPLLQGVVFFASSEVSAFWNSSNSQEPTPDANSSLPLENAYSECGRRIRIRSLSGGEANYDALAILRPGGRCL